MKAIVSNDLNVKRITDVLNKRSKYNIQARAYINIINDGLKCRTITKDQIISTLVEYRNKNFPTGTEREAISMAIKFFQLKGLKYNSFYKDVILYFQAHPETLQDYIIEFRDLLNSDPDFNYSYDEFDDWLQDYLHE